MGNTPSAVPSAAPATHSSKHQSVGKRQRKREELKKSASTSTRTRPDAVIVSAGRTEEKKEEEKKEVAPIPQVPDSSLNQKKANKKNEKDAFVCNWLDRMANQKPYDPQELAVRGADGINPL